jgi:hypothetical protein
MEETMGVYGRVGKEAYTGEVYNTWAQVKSHEIDL